MKLAEEFNIAVLLVNQVTAGNRQQKLFLCICFLFFCVFLLFFMIVFLFFLIIDPSGGMSAFVGEVRKPIGGHIMVTFEYFRVFVHANISAYLF